MILKNNTADIIVSRQFMNSDLAQKGLLWLPFVLLTALLLLLLLLSFVRFHVKNKHRYVKRRREGDSEVLSQLADGTINVAALPRKHSQRRMSMCASTVNVRSVVRDSLLEQMERARKNSRDMPMQTLRQQRQLRLTQSCYVIPETPSSPQFIQSKEIRRATSNDETQTTDNTMYH